MGFKNYAWAAGLYVVINAALYSTEYSKGGASRIKGAVFRGKTVHPAETARREFSEQYQRGGSQAGYGQLETYD